MQKSLRDLRAAVEESRAEYRRRVRMAVEFWYIQEFGLLDGSWNGVEKTRKDIAKEFDISEGSLRHGIERMGKK